MMCTRTTLPSFRYASLQQTSLQLPLIGRYSQYLVIIGQLCRLTMAGGFLGAFTKLRKATISFVMYVCLPVRPSVRPSWWNRSAPTGRIFIKFDIWLFFENLSGKFKFHWNLTRITLGYFIWDQYILMIISRSFLLRMKNIPHKICRGNKNTFYVQ